MLPKSSKKGQKNGENEDHGAGQTLTWNVGMKSSQIVTWNQKEFLDMANHRLLNIIMRKAL